MTYRPLQEHSNYVVHYISSTFVKIEQLKTDLNAEYQQEKHALTELNEQLRLMIDRVEQLESQNSTYVAKLTDLRRQGFIVATTGKQNDEHYRLQSHIMAVNYEKVSYESEIEFFQLQIKIYQQMIQAENQSIDEQRLKLEQELNQSASALVNLRTSYEELGNKVGSYRTMCKETLQHQCSLFLTDMSDFAEFWKVEWKQIIEKIRHDFELLYGAMHQETISFYEKKTQEVQAELEQITQYQPVEQEAHIKIQQQLQSEYEEVQKKFASEKQVLLETEATYSKLESELNTIQTQYEEQFTAQASDLDYLQESILAMVSSIEEMRRRKISLQSEIIIYRHLLSKQVILQYTVPDGLRLQPGSELKIYSESGAAVAQKLSNQSAFSSSLHQELVLKDISSMGM
ncbi:unnamed protein product [Rotaria sp. Silwood1]|nr:unnamed protein product [Rotaria sp. Silwood1]